MALQCGIVGLPNVGKSTLFNALTKTQAAQASNYPFCTIDPNVGVVAVPDPRFDYLVKLVSPKSNIPASVEFVDIAGLVKGAAQGEGLGNQFLSHIAQVNAVLHIVRCFDDENITHVHGGINPINDVETIELELALSDLARIEKRLENLAKKKKSGEKDAAQQVEMWERVKSHLSIGAPARSLDFSEKEEEFLKELPLLSLKPVLFVANIEEENVSKPENNSQYLALKELAEQRGCGSVAVSCKIESEIAVLNEDEAELFLQDLGLEEPGLNKIIQAAYSLLGYITFFTAGEQEVRAWQIKSGTLAPAAASVIHTDIEKGFIRAEVTPFTEVESYGSQKKAQEAGKMRLEGKDYGMQDGDVVYFRFNV